jgi:outer membrane murein-binding lipoprotein Lpp
MKLNVQGLLGKIAGLPDALVGGLLGPTSVNPQLGLDPASIKGARQGALTDMSMGLIAGGSRPLGLMQARQFAQEGHRGRIIDMMREQEMLRLQKQREAGDAYIQTLPENLRAVATVAGPQAVADAQIQSALAPPKDDRTDDIKEYGFYVEQEQQAGNAPLSFNEWMQQTKSAGATKITVGGQAEKVPKYFEERQKQIATQVTELEANADKAAASVRRWDGLIEKSNKAKLKGTMAPGVIGAAEFLRSLGVEIAPEAIQDARTFQSAIAGNHMAWVQSLGGARGMTEFENKKLAELFPKIQDSPEARLAILKALRDADAQNYEAARKGVTRKNKQLDSLAQGDIGIADFEDLPAAPEVGVTYPRARNPQTGEEMILKDGKWQKP